MNARLESADVHGVVHRHGCHAPGWVSHTAARAGVHVLRCAGCGAVRLVRAGDAR